MSPLIPPTSNGLNSTTTILPEDRFGIKLSKKVDVPLKNKQAIFLAREMIIYLMR